MRMDDMKKQYTFSELLDALMESDDTDHDDATDIATKKKTKTKKPSQYKVVLLNDDFTPMDFVIGILMGIFRKTQQEATDIMLNVHETGIGVAGIYTFEIAETKAAQVLDTAKRQGHPLKCTLEKA